MGLQVNGYFDSSVADQLKAGARLNELLNEFPGVTREQVEQVVAFFQE